MVAAGEWEESERKKTKKSAKRTKREKGVGGGGDAGGGVRLSPTLLSLYRSCTNQVHTDMVTCPTDDSNQYGGVS